MTNSIFVIKYSYVQFLKPSFEARLEDLQSIF